MKKLFVLLTAIGAFAFIPFTTAEAGGCNYRLIGYTPCGKPIYSYFHVHGYDQCGHPVGHWVTQYPSNCGCASGHTCHPKPVTQIQITGSGGQIYIQSSGSGWGFQAVK